VSEATVHRIGFDVVAYQALVFDLPNPTREDFRFAGQSKLVSWVPRRVYVDGPRRERPDIWHLFGAAVLVMSESIVALLEPFVTGAGELLPLVVSGTDEELLALNVLEVHDLIDPAAYSLDTLELYPHFLAHRLPESGLFKLPQTDTVDIFHLERVEDDDSFRARVERHALKGIEFQRVWSSKTGPEAMNLFRS
jgi:hypothetical protein